MGLSVLIVDDSSAIRERLTEMLRATHGVASIAHAATTVEARQAIAGQAADVVVLDILLPDGSGIDLLKAIKRSNAASTVIMLTNCPSAPYRTRCRQAGANFFLDKSSEFESLPLIIAGLARDAGVKS